jgi:hypothetical protein
MSSISNRSEVSNQVLPDHMMAQIVEFLDLGSQASFSKVCKYLRQIIKETGISLSILGRASSLTDELWTSGFYGTRVSMTDEAREAKAERTERWFEYLRKGDASKNELEQAIIHLSGINDIRNRHHWSEAKIDKLCEACGYQRLSEINYWTLQLTKINPLSKKIKC